MPRPREFDPDLVLDRAVELFWAKGYEGTSISDLEEHLGMGRQSLYGAFGDKHELYVKAMDRYAGLSVVDQTRSAQAGRRCRGDQAVLQGTHFRGDPGAAAVLHADQRRNRRAIASTRKWPGAAPTISRT
jgi:AcrR family transcriptional regulator